MTAVLRMNTGWLTSPVTESLPLPEVNAPVMLRAALDGESAEEIEYILLACCEPDFLESPEIRTLLAVCRDNPKAFVFID